MSTVADEDERRRRSLEAGKEMLEKYKSERSKTKGTGHSQGEEMSDEESIHNDKSLGHRESCAHEGISSKDVTHSSVSMSEGEGDGDLEGLAGRVAELEELLQGKEAIVEALNAELDHLRAEASSPYSSQSQNSSTHGKDVISMYHTKLQEFEKAINKRDNFIEDLTCSLEQALAARDGVVAQLSSLNAMQIAPSTTNNMNLQEKIDTLESTLSDQKSVIQKLNAQLAEIHEHVQTLEMEKETRNAEINDYKLQINNLNEQIRIGATERNLNIAETLEQQKQYEARVDGIKQHMQLILERFTAETNTNAARHQQELKDLTAKHDAEIMNIQMKYEECATALKKENKTLADRLNKELPDLETRHAKELSVFQAQLAHYKKTVESLKSELVNRSETQQTAQAEVNHYKNKLDQVKMQAENARRVQDLNHQKEKEMLGEQIKLHKIQLEEITTKYVAATAILESKESIERSLEQALENAGRLKDENQCLKFKLDDLSSRYSTAQSLIENSQAHERTLSSRIFDLEKSLSRVSGINVSTLSEFNETTYQTFDEAAIQYQLTKQKLDEKAELEKLLVEKVHGLEEDVRQSKEELEQANLAKKSYEKQLKDMKNTCDKLKSEVAFFKETNLRGERKSLDQDSIDTIRELSRKAEEDQQEIKSLRSKLEEKETEITDYARNLAELTDKMKKAEDECDQLKNGLATAWAQCAEVEEKLNQTLALNDSKLDISLSKSAYSSALMSQFRLGKTINESVNTTHNQSAETDKSYCDKETDTEKILHAKIASLTEENQNILKELESLKGLQAEYDAIKNQLNHYSTLVNKSSSEKQQVEEENMALKDKLENINSLKESINQLRSEKESLRKEIETLVSVQNEQISAIKAESSAEIKKMQSLFLSVKEGNADRSELKAELEERHAKEMEELRRYFEQKCLDMEKQYSEEIFSQKSKKMSDNDSELEELTDNLYYGGAGDCLNVSNISEPISRAESPAVEVQSKYKSGNQENLSKTELEYEASIKALRQELERKIIKIQETKLHYEKVLEDQRNLYEREVHDVRERRNYELFRNRVNQHCQTEWDAGALENGELSQLREAYNRQLEEQITLARLDIVNALQEQIQALLAVESDGEDSWPPELLEIRDKFTNNAKKEMQQIKEAHHDEILRLKEDHSRHVARIIDRHQEELNKLKVEDHSQEIGSLEHNIMRERDALNKTCTMLKGLVEELIKYFVICEEELNNTVITEVLKRQFSGSFYNAEKTVQTMDNEIEEADEAQETEESNAPQNTSEIKIKRVHFAPQPTEIVSIINSDTDTLLNMFEEDDQIEEKLKQALNKCLDRLKSESTEILGATSSAGGDRFSALSKEIMWMNKVNEELTMKVNHAEALIMGYQEESEQLKITILNLKRKLANAESKKEIITEGYGEHDEGGGDVVMQDFSELQEKARHILSNGGGDYPYLLQIIEEFCRQSEKLVEDGKKEKEDLQQQVPLEPTPPPYIHRVCCRKIEAADKQLRATRKFLDEQASEREAERDEAAKQIHLLQEQLKEREREKERDQRISSEPSLSPDPSSDVPAFQATDINAAVEALESQMREMSSLMSESEAKKSETEAELQATTEKIWVLREIITGLEQQLILKSEKEESLQVQIKQLETVIAAQTKNQHELAQELDSVKMGSESRRLNEHINHLQEELNKHKLSSEQFNVNSAALKQMKLELRDMQNQLDKRIKELESSHICGSNLSLSQPSEDVSVREQIDANRCPTPDDPNSPPMLPLEQLLKLKEKMSKHARVEEVAFKRIKDLEMQLNVIKNQNEELQAEQDILQQTASEQLFQIEAMRGRLEQHKQSAPFAQRQATSRLELQLHEANSKFQSLERTIADRDLELKDMKSHLDRVNQLLLEKEAEIANVVELEGGTIKKLKERLEVLEEENNVLQTKVGVQEHAQIELPRLIDSMLADKNEEIDHLKEQLTKKEKQLEIYSSVTLDDAQLKNVIKQIEPKNSARTLSDILSIHSECEEMSEAIRCTQNATQTLPHNVSSFKVPTSSTLAKDTLDFSTVPFIDPNTMNINIPPLDLGSHSQSLSSTSNQNMNVSLGMDLINSGMESKTFSPDDNVSVENTNCEVRSQQNVQESLQRKSSANDSNKSHFMSVKQTQTSINESIKEIQNLENQLHAAQQELEMKTAILDKREADLAILQKLYDELRSEFKEVTETLTQDKYFYQNQYELTCASENKIKKDLHEVENTLKLRTEEIQEHKSKLQVNEKIIMELNTENTKLRKDMQKKEEEQMRKYSILLQENIKELQSLRDAVLEKDITIETIQTRNIEIENENKQLYEFKTKYQQCKQDLVECQNEIRRLTEGLNNRDQVIRRLEDMARRTSISGASSPSDEKDQEIHHLQEYLKEKDKVIRQMSDDSKSLHRALETIQNKMKESGNIVELRKKLKEERKLNAEFQEMIQKLSKELDDLKQPLNRRAQDDTDIEDMVQRELNLSAHLDRQIMNAIESDSEENRMKDDVNEQNRNSSSSALQLKFIQANKTNEELKKMKDDLEIERGILKCQIAEYENRIFQLKSDLSEECKKVSKLDEELSSERNLVRTLKIQIEKSQREMQSDHVQDTELIEFLQEKLKSSIENEAKLRSELSLLRQEQSRLEKLEYQKTENSSNFENLLEAERKKYLLLMKDFEQGERTNAELRDTLKRVQMEKNRYESQLEVTLEGNEKLISSLALVEGIKEHLETDLRRTKEEVKALEEECEWLQKRVKTMCEAETKRQEQRATEHSQIKGLKREINNAREVMTDLEADMKQSKRELTESLEREMKLSQSLEAAKERGSELSQKLSIAKEAEKKLKEMITDLQLNLKMTTVRELDLTKELKSRFSSENNGPAIFVQRIKELSEANERCVNEQIILRDKLTKVQEEKDQLSQCVKLLESLLIRAKASQNSNDKNVESTEKMQHLYGNYLRADSRRKALTFQKRYLLGIVACYQISEENTLCILAQLTQSERSHTLIDHNRKNPRVRFRSAVLVLISIHRMKWLIQRWRIGKRVGAKALLWNAEQSFPAIWKANLNHSPPVKDKPTSNGEGGSSDIAFGQYYERIRNIQDTLGLAMKDPGNRMIIPE